MREYPGRVIFEEGLQQGEQTFAVKAFLIHELGIVLVHMWQYTSEPGRRVTKVLGTDFLGEPGCAPLGPAVRLVVQEADLFFEKVRAADGWPF